MNDLPEFEERSLPQVEFFARGVFGDNLVELISYDDGHYRAVFKETQFSLSGDKPVPTKSQWSTLKKRLKRHDKATFVFKETGEADCAGGQPEEPEGKCYYIDFGFFAFM